MLWTGRISSSSAISDTRHLMSSALEAVGVEGACTGDIILVLTELATNAFDHGAADHVDVTVERGVSGSSIVLRVIHHEDVDRFAPPDPPVMASPHESSGRGRAIIAAVSSSFITERRAPNRIDNVVEIAI